MTVCSEVVVLELRHHRWIRRGWRCQHRPLYVQIRVAQPPELLLPGISDPGFEVLSSPKEPCAFSFNGLRGGPGLLSLVRGPFKGLLPD